MAALFKNVSIMDCRVGVSLGHDSGNVVFDGGSISSCGTAVEQRDPPNLIQSLGLPADLPPDVLLAALRILVAHKNTTDENKAALLANSKIGPYLQNAANFSTAVTSLIALSASPFCAQTISFLASL